MEPVCLRSSGRAALITECLRVRPASRPASKSASPGCLAGGEAGRREAPQPGYPRRGHVGEPWFPHAASDKREEGVLGGTPQVPPASLAREREAFHFDPCRTVRNCCL